MTTNNNVLQIKLTQYDVERFKSKGKHEVAIQELPEEYNGAILLISDLADKQPTRAYLHVSKVSLELLEREGELAFEFDDCYTGTRLLGLINLVGRDK